MPIEGITRFCFAASYSLAFLLELARIPWPARGWQVAGWVAGGAGLFAHTAYLLMHRPSPATPTGSLLILSWVLAVFFLYGTLHHRKSAWGLFVLPLVLILVGLSVLFAGGDYADWKVLTSQRSWGIIHGGLMLLAAIGVCVGCVSSVMYLIQSRRLRRKSLGKHGVPLMSLERLERMNRRAIDWAFPLWTAGLLLGAVLMYVNRAQLSDWAALKVAGTGGLWVVFLLLMYLRYGAHLPGRRLSMLTIVAFLLMLVTMAASHEFAVPGGSA